MPFISVIWRRLFPVIGMVAQDGMRPVNLFSQKPANHQVRPGHLAKG